MNRNASWVHCRRTTQKLQFSQLPNQHGTTWAVTSTAQWADCFWECMIEIIPLHLFCLICFESVSANDDMHSQKQSAHWAVDVTAQVVPCWLGSWLNRNYWLVLGPWIQLAFQSSERKITWVSYTKTVDSGISRPVNRKPPGSAAFEHLKLPCI